MSQVSMKREHCTSDTQDPGHGPEAFSYFYSYLLSLIMAPCFTVIVLYSVCLSVKCHFNRDRPSQGAGYSSQCCVHLCSYQMIPGVDHSPVVLFVFLIALFSSIICKYVIHYLCCS